MTTRHFRDLLVWQKSMALAVSIYTLTDRFPKRENFGLSAQMRRSAVSVPSNIAEGHGRLSDPSLALFLGHARGSLYELETQTELAIQLALPSQLLANSSSNRSMRWLACSMDYWQRAEATRRRQGQRLRA